MKCEVLTSFMKLGTQVEEIVFLLLPHFVKGGSEEFASSFTLETRIHEKSEHIASPGDRITHVSERWVAFLLSCKQN